MNNETQVRRGRADVRFPMAPPRNLHRAMVGSDEVIIITNLEWANRFAHVSAVKETCAANGKIASVEGGMGDLGPDRRAHPAGRRSARGTRSRRSRARRRVRVTTELGTDFTVSIEGRPALEVTPIKKRGQMMGPVPLWAEVAFAAVEDFTHGTAVVDGVMLGIGLPGQVEEPITLDARGRQGCVAIEGGDEAERLRKAIDGVENADVVGEFAFGTSEKAPFGTPSEKGRDRHRPPRARRQPQRLPGRAERLLAPPRRRLPERHDADRRRRHLHPEGRRMGCCNASSRSTDVDPIELPQGSWSRMLVTGERAAATRARSATRCSRRARCSRRCGTRPRRSPTSSRARASSGSTAAPVPFAAGRRAPHPGRGLARGREHGRRGRRDGLRLPAPGLPADRAALAAASAAVAEPAARAGRVGLPRSSRSRATPT